MKCLILFTKDDFIYKNVVCDGDGRKTAKKFHLVALPSPFYDMEADCFSVSKNTENKPDLREMRERSNLQEQKEKDWVGCGENR